MLVIRRHASEQLLDGHSARFCAIPTKAGTGLSDRHRPSPAWLL
jgi:hypothetical protein